MFGNRHTNSPALFVSSGHGGAMCMVADCHDYDQRRYHVGWPTLARNPGKVSHLRPHVHARGFHDARHDLSILLQLDGALFPFPYGSARPYCKLFEGLPSSMVQRERGRAWLWGSLLVFGAEEASPRF